MRRKKKIRVKNKKPLLQEFNELRSLIHPETEKSILAIIFIGFSAILILAGFHNAGPAGEFIFDILTKLFGLGYYLFPTVFLIISGVFLSGREQQEKGFTMTFLGASLFVIAGLGLIDIVYSDRGGLVGRWFGTIEQPFGYIAGIVITITVLVIALLLTLNLPLRLRLIKKDSSNPEKDSTPQIIIKNPEVFPKTPKVVEPQPPPKKTEKEETKEEFKKEDEEKLNPPADGESPKAFFTPRKNNQSEDKIKKYTPPPTSLLKSTIEKPAPGDLRANANIIKRTLDSFGVPVEMGEITIGPKVTRYTLKPAEGVKLTRIIALNQDLALALAAHPIRIEAPIPGKPLVGIEVPNKSAAIVRLGSLMAYPEFTSSGPLEFILGRDVSGELIVADIEKMPHLLIAGSTGSGKSVTIHALITSLLYKNSPETLRMVMIDPKRVELTIYNDIPHLITPVIIDGKKALGVFRWAIDEMENRYERLQSAGARDIGSYNKSNPDELMPYIVIIVDELADLMAAYGRDIESSIVRLAQMARATGIHLILSTQRPSVEVITGLIKANITARVALQVASQIDSRTILDSAGAEKLLGGGDMLFINSSLSKPKRIQGAYISEEEIHKVAKFIKDNNKPSKTDEGNAEISDFGPKEPNRIEIKEGIDFTKYSKDDDDDLYEEAISEVRRAQKASASLLQRRLSIGYARAARLLDIMEDRGIIGPGDGAKPREVYLDKEDSNIDNEF